jgi:hypothetical protein
VCSVTCIGAQVLLYTPSYSRCRCNTLVNILSLTLILDYDLRTVYLPAQDIISSRRCVRLASPFGRLSVSLLLYVYVPRFRDTQLHHKGGVSGGRDAPAAKLTTGNRTSSAVCFSRVASAPISRAKSRIAFSPSASIAVAFAIVV